MKKTKAMVMAAGMGSRLEPITLSLPKPLIPVMNIPIMDIILSNLKKIGVNDVISNTYYLADKIINRYSQNELGINFNYIKETELSGTAGGMKKCQYFFDEGEDFIVMSGDLLTTADIAKGLERHKKSGAIATIGVKEIEHDKVSNFGVVVTDENGFIKEFQEKPSLDEAKSNLINTGIYIFNYKIFDYIPENEFYDFAKNVFPKLLLENQIDTFNIDGYWNDIGTLDQYKQTIKDIFEGKCKIKHSSVTKTPKGKYISDSKIPQSTRLIGYNVIGNNCRIGENVTLENCVVLDHSQIKPFQKYSNCIITRNLSDCDYKISTEKSKHVVLL